MESAKPKGLWPANPTVASAAALLSLTLLLAACSSSSSPQNKSHRAASSTTSIQELHLLAMPLALDLDGNPGVDGFAVRIFAINRSEPKSQPIREGTLDILMFDGSETSSSILTNQPRHAWSFTAEQLLLFKFASSIGVAYSLTPIWTTNKPSLHRISVVARFQPPQGNPIYSAPSTIAVAPQ